MAQQAVTPEKETYCSSCSARVSPEDSRCPHCKEEFTSVIEVSTCNNCHSIVALNSASCPKCGTEFKSGDPSAGFNETEYLRRMLLWRDAIGQKMGEGGGPKGPGQDILHSVSEMSSSPAPLPINLLYQMSEPLERVLKLRKKRLEHMDVLIDETKQRIDELEKSDEPTREKEQARLKRWIEETLAERDDLATIEKSMVEMERIYKNLLALQQSELQSKEESIRMRLDSMRTELERMEREKLSIRDREEEMKRREDELRKILERIGEKEKELAALERLLNERVKEAETYKKKLEETEKQIEKDKWLTAQRQIQSQLISMKTKDLVVETAPQEVAEINTRVSELEERMERLTEERDRMAQEKEETSRLVADVSRLLKILDDLLGALPPEVIKKFSKSGDFRLYETVLQKCGV